MQTLWLVGQGRPTREKMSMEMTFYLHKNTYFLKDFQAVYFCIGKHYGWLVEATPTME